MLTRTVAGRVFDASHSVGRNAQAGLGFYYPVDAALGEGDLVYVLNRGGENISNVPWNHTATGTRISVITIGDASGDEELLADVGRYGDGDGEFIWATGIASDSQGNLFVTDERLHRVSVFDKGGGFVSVWGAQGDAPGRLNGPAGVALDGDGNLLIVDSLGHRVQRFTTQGRCLGGWGEHGHGDGQLDTPWGITVDSESNIFVADWRNNRVQKLSPEGRHLATIGGPGSEAELSFPAGVAVDKDGDIYVADWGNNLLRVYEADGSFITNFVGDAWEVSQWAADRISADPMIQKKRRLVDLSPTWKFWRPVAVNVDDEGRVMALEALHHRLQVYLKEQNWLEPDFIDGAVGAPFN